MRGPFKIRGFTKSGSRDHPLIADGDNQTTNVPNIFSATTQNMLEDIEQEIETLSYIYTQEMTINDPKSISIYCENDDQELQIDSQLFQVSLNFPDEYPECVPEIIIESEHLSEDEIDALTQQVIQECQNSVGMAMTFTIYTFLKDKVNEILRDRIKQQEQKVVDDKLKQEREEAQRYWGTRVNLDSFKEWKLKFIKEAFEQEKLGNTCPAFEAAIAVERMNQITGKRTGRQLFEDGKLIKSDEKFADEGDEMVVDITSYNAHVEEESNVGLLNFTEDDVE